MNNPLSPQKHSTPTLLRLVLLAALVVLITLFGGAQIVYAQSGADAPPDNIFLPIVSGDEEISSRNIAPVTVSDASGNADVTYGARCMEEEAGFGLNCTANDISIANVTNINILDDGCAFPGDTITFSADFEVKLTADARHDVGLWFASDGDPNSDGAITGMCTAATPAYAPDPPWLDLDGTLDPFPGTNKASGIQDTCGDINNDHNPLYPSVTLTVVCTDEDGNGKLDLPNCTSWRQPGANNLCTSPIQSFPGAPSKCKCDPGFDINIDVPASQIIVDKVTSPAGDMTQFYFSLTGGPNNANLSFALTDGSLPYESEFLMAGTYSVVETANSAYATVATCDDGSPANAIILGPGEIVKCTFTNTLLEGPPSILVMKTAEPPTVREPGGMVLFTVSIQNKSDATDPVTINSLIDNVHGDLNGQGSCSVPQTILPGDTYTCAFSAAVMGNAGYKETDTVTATGTDNEGTPVEGSASATVTVSNEPAVIQVVKTAAPTAVYELGGNVTFSFLVTNESTVDKVTITSLTDSIYGDLTAVAGSSCTVPQELAVGASYSCSITVFVDGNAGYIETNTVTASGVDDDGMPVSDIDDETVTVNDVPSSIQMVKTASPSSVDEPGGNVEFTFEVKNTSAVDSVTINELTDSIYGNLTAVAGSSCTVPQMIPAGSSYTCKITAFVDGNAGFIETNVATAKGVDDDGNNLTASDDATVTVNDLPSSIEMVKSAVPSTVEEPGDDVTFTFEVKNRSTVDTVTINSLTDTVYGNLGGQGTCAVPQTIPAGGSYTCSITMYVAGNAFAIHTNVATASGTDDDGVPVSDDDSETVTITDLPSAIAIVKSAAPSTVNEPGGDVTFTFEITNLSMADTVTLESLTDTIYGNLDGQGSCDLPQTLAAGGSYTCSITVLVKGNAGEVEKNVATVTGTDDDGQALSAADDATVTLNDVQSAIEVVKTASPTAVSELGGDVTFSFRVENLSTVDTVTLNSLTDTIYGELDGQGTCAVPQTILPNGTYECSFTTFVSGDTNDPIHMNVVTASGVDDDGDPVSDTDDAEVTIVDVPSAIEINKSAVPSTVNEPGGDVTFIFEIKNLSTVDKVTITSLTDSIYGDLTAVAGSSCTVPQELAVGASYSCSITVFVDGNAGYIETNTVTASGVDDDGMPVSDIDDETVTVNDVPSSIQMVKTASPSSVDEPGGNVEFTFEVKNTSAVDSVTINELTDSIYGNLTAVAGSSCAVPQMIPAGSSYTCKITAFVDGNAGYIETNVATAKGVDDDGNNLTASDDATVTVNDLPSSIKTTKSASPSSVPETGGDVMFTIVVQNTSLVDTVKIEEVTDDVFGNVSSIGTCTPALPASLLPGEMVTCIFTRFISGDYPGSHINVTTATGTDDDNTPVEDKDEEEVPFADVLPDITVTKTAMEPAEVPETGGMMTFEFVVTNNSTEAAKITSLADDKFGPLAGDADCQVDTELAGGASCTFSATFAIPAGDYPGSHVNTFTAIAEDDDGNTDSGSNSETVTYTDVLPDIRIAKTASPTSVPETGGDVEFTIVVTNYSLEEATIDSLVDSDFKLAAHCPDAVGIVLQSGESYICTFTELISGDFSGMAHENTATVVASDNDGNSDTASDDATVTFTDVLPDITVTKTADPTIVPETGGNVVFTFLVKNIGVEDVTLTSLSDTIFGDLNGQGGCVTGGLIPVGGSYSCSITKLLASDNLTAHYNVVTAVGTDNDGSKDEATDDETVEFTDVRPDIMITKTAMPTSVPETGGDVEFTIVVTNYSLEAATIDSLVDSDFDLAAHCPDAVGTVLAYGESYTCVFTKMVAGDFGVDHENTATVEASDNDGNTATASDDETVEFTDVLPDITVTKTANPTYVIAPSGEVTFNFVVKNNGLEAATITALSDDQFGMLTGDADCMDGTVLAAGVSCSFSATFTVSGAGGTSHVNVFTAAASDDDGNADTASDDATVDILTATSKIAPTATTCQQYRDGTAQDYTELFYLVSKGKIGSVSPGVIFYYSTITAPAASFQLKFTQANDLSWKAMAVKQVVLWDSNCVKVQSVTVTIGKADGSATISVTGATPGATYYLSVKPDPGSLTGIPLKKPYPTANYTFNTSMNGSLIVTSPDSIAVRPKDATTAALGAEAALPLYMPDIRQ